MKQKSSPIFLTPLQGPQGMQQLALGFPLGYTQKFVVS
jgi:hypothetical protein